MEGAAVRRTWMFGDGWAHGLSSSQESVGSGGTGASLVWLEQRIREEECRADWRGWLGPPWTSG